MQSTVYLLQQQLKESKEKVASLQAELQTLRSQAPLASIQQQAPAQAWTPQLVPNIQTPASPDSPLPVPQHSELVHGSHVAATAHPTMIMDSPASPPQATTLTSRPPTHNGNHGNHPTPMDTDACEQDSSDDVVSHSHLAAGRHRQSHGASMDSTHTIESTDASSDGGCSPNTASTKYGVVSSSEQRTLSDRTEDKNGRTKDSNKLQNGLLGQYDSQGDSDN